MDAHFINTLNKLSNEKAPFLFIIDFEMKKPHVWRLDEIVSEEVKYSFRGVSNAHTHSTLKPEIFISQKNSFDTFKKKFEIVQNHLRAGNSYVTNLSLRTPLNINATLEEFFYAVSAPYKMWWRDNFCFFSPESFIQINDGVISTFPMKGTVDATEANAEEFLLSNEKEKYEHITIVDLLRNDLSKVAKEVQVKRFRYIQKVKSTTEDLLQTSSEISGIVMDEYKENIGSLLEAVLPAGSVSGAPKQKTLEIISEVEQVDRGYYTGVCGMYDGINFDSAVMIRFIEQTTQGLFYRSGGGITARSDVHEEFNEIEKKIYAPVD